MQKSIKKNMIMNIILTVSNFAFPLITYTYVSRVLGAEGTGKVAFANSIIQYFHYFAALGIPYYGLRECAKVRDNKESLSHLVQELVIINLVATAISYTILFTILFTIPKLFNYRILIIVMSSSIFLLSIGMEWLYQALEEYSYITIRSIILKSISVFLTFILIKSADDYIYYGALTIFASSASYICNFFHARKFINIKKNGHYNLKRHIKPVLTMFLASAAITIYSNFDVSMIGFINSDREVGLYNAALRMKNIVLSVSTAATSVIIPRMAYYFKKKQLLKMKDMVIRSAEVSMLLCFPLAVFVFIFSKNILLFVCGDGYLEASGTLKLLMLCIVPLIFTNLFGNQLLIQMGLEKRYTESIVVGLFINLALNLMLIPPFGAPGAAIGTLITEWWNVFWMSNKIKEFRSTVIKGIRWLQYLFSIIVSIVITSFFNIILSEFHIFIQLALCAIIFFGTYYVGLLLSKEQLITSQVHNIISKIRSIYDFR